MTGEYGFIPLAESRVQRRSWDGFTGDRLQAGLCHGDVTFRLTNATSMLINTGTDADGFPKAKGDEKSWLKSRHPNHKGQPVVPGSSLKGMIRSTYECLTHSCLKQVANEYQDNQKRGSFLEPKPRNVAPLQSNQNAVKPCIEGEKLCPSCLLFGTLSAGSNRVWKGRVSISDGMLAPEQDPKMGHQILPVLSTPRPKRRQDSQYPDYFPEGRMAGRKRYQARSRPVTAIRRNGRRSHDYALKMEKAETLKPNHHFQVRVFYQNLTHAELGVLLRCFLLEEGLHHVLGAAKAHGWGACHFDLTDWRVLDPTKRFRGEEGLEKLPPKRWTATQAEYLTKAQQCGLYHPKTFENLRPFLQPLTT